MNKKRIRKKKWKKNTPEEFRYCQNYVKKFANQLGAKFEEEFKNEL